MRKFILPICFLLGILPLVSDLPAEEKGTYPCYRLVKEPVLDGILSDDPAWDSIPVASDFFAILQSSYLIAVKQTVFKMACTPEAVFIGIRCEEPDIDLIKSTAKDNEVKIWQEDSVEIFLFPKGAAKFCQFMVSAAGSRWNTTSASGMPAITIADWQAKTSRGQDYWSAEIKIPFRIFGKVPADGEIWTGNICRNILTPGSLLEDGWGDRFTSWANVSHGYGEEDKFRGIVFHDNCLPASDVKKNEEEIKLQTASIAGDEINRRIEVVREEISRILAVLFSQKKVLLEASRSPAWQKDVDSIFIVGDRIKDEMAGTKKGTLAELHSIKKLDDDSRDLLYRADELKRRMLIKIIFKQGGSQP